MLLLLSAVVVVEGGILGLWPVPRHHTFQVRSPARFWACSEKICDIGVIVGSGCGDEVGGGGGVMVLELCPQSLDRRPTLLFKSPARLQGYELVVRLLLLIVVVVEVVVVMCVCGVCIPRVWCVCVCVRACVSVCVYVCVHVCV